MRGLVIAVATLLVLTGCAPAEDTESTGSTDTEQTEQAEQTEQSTESESQSSEPLVELPLDAFPTESLTPIATLDDAVRIAANTFDRFDKTGIVEVIESPEGEVVLIHNPDQLLSYTASWYNTIDGSGELIFDATEFTSAWPFLTLAQLNEARENGEDFPEIYFGEQPGGFTLELDDPSFGRYGYNYLSDGEYLLGAWWQMDPNDPDAYVLLTYDFEVDQEYKDILDRQVDEFLAGLEE